MYAVTGGSGFIGLNLVEALLRRGETVLSISLDGFPAVAAAEFARLPGRVVDAVADVTDGDAVARLLAAHGIRRLFHGAVITAGEAREREAAARILEVNIVGATRVVEAAARSGVARVVLASSSAVYGEAFFGAGPVPETVQPVPRNLYGISKLATELMGRRLAALHGLSVAAARITAAMGPWERDTGLRDTLSPMFQIACLAAEGRPVRLPKGGLRDWVHAPDVAAALVRLLDAAELPHFAYNVSPGVTWHPARFCEALQAVWPALDWALVDDEAAATIAFMDDLGRTRQPADIGRLRDLWPGAELSPSAALDSFARWIADHPSWFAASPSSAER
ncbi:MAG: NAD(P)-dependent oxidoreductase [Sneathiellaceae bacterium]